MKPVAPIDVEDLQSVDALSEYWDYLDVRAAYDKAQLRDAVTSGFQPENQNFTTMEQVNTYLDAWNKTKQPKKKQTTELTEKN